MKVAIVGVSGAVGQEFLRVLDQRNFPMDELVLFGSSRSAGRVYTFRGKQYTVKELKHNDDFKGIDVAFVSAGGGTSKEFEKTITKHGTVMIDNSSAFRMDEDVPLVVPEVNPEDALNRPRGVIANPNCTTIQMVVALKAIENLSHIKRVHVSTYQAASGAGATAMAELVKQYEQLLKGEEPPYEEQYGHAIPVFVAGGVYTGADMAHFTKLGAAGVQLATRFIPTYECDASQTYKDVLLAAKPEDVRIIHSPVGMPGRALNTPLVQALAEGKRFPPKHCARCLKTCDPAAVPYCITHALIEAVKGNVEEGLFFCGENVGRLDRMRTVRELMDELVTEWRQNL